MLDVYTLSTVYEQLIRRSTDKPGTVVAYQNALDHWREFSGDPPLSEISNSLLAQFMATLAGSGRSPATVNKFRRHILAIINRCGPAMKGNPAGLGLIERPLFVAPLPESPPEPRRIDDAIVGSIYRSASVATWPFYVTESNGPTAGDWWRCLLVFLWNTGMRRTDAFLLNWSSIDLQAGRVTWTAKKTGKRQTVPLVPTVVDHLVGIRTRAPRVFPTYPGAGQHGERTRVDAFKTSLYRQWRKIQAEAGIADRDRITFKELRETAGSNYYAVSPGAAQELLGHSDIRTTRRHYAELSEAMRATGAAIAQPAAFTNGPDDDGAEVIRFPTAG